MADRRAAAATRIVRWPIGGPRPRRGSSEGRDAATRTHAQALARVGAYYKLRALYSGNSRAADGYSPETEPQRDQVREFYERRAAPATETPAAETLAATPSTETPTDALPFDGMSCVAFKLDQLQSSTPRSLGGWEPPTASDGGE